MLTMEQKNKTKVAKLDMQIEDTLKELKEVYSLLEDEPYKESYREHVKELLDLM